TNLQLRESWRGARNQVARQFGQLNLFPRQAHGTDEVMDRIHQLAAGLRPYFEVPKHTLLLAPLLGQALAENRCGGVERLQEVADFMTHQARDRFWKTSRGRRSYSFGRFHRLPLRKVRPGFARMSSHKRSEEHPIRSTLPRRRSLVKDLARSGN